MISKVQIGNTRLQVLGKNMEIITLSETPEPGFRRIGTFSTTPEHTPRRLGYRQSLIARISRNGLFRFLNGLGTFGFLDFFVMACVG